MARLLLKLAGIGAALVAVLASAGGAAAESDEYGVVEPPCVGIDLGTTYSVVGVWQDGGVKIIPNEMDNRITPSVVAFTSSERLVGDGAKAQIAENPENTVYAVKRLIGRKYTDKTVQTDKKLLSFAVAGDKEGNPRVQVQYKGETMAYTPEEVSAMVLQKMKVIAEEFIGKPVKNAVVTVPAYFTDAQRQATKDAGTIAGLDVVRIVNEPTAAALGYGLGMGDKTILVFNLGGGAFDVSLLTSDDGFVEVAATNGDTHLGGEDFTNRMMKHFLPIIKQKMINQRKESEKTCAAGSNGQGVRAWLREACDLFVMYLMAMIMPKEVDIGEDQGALARLRTACEAAKRQLSSQLEVRVEVDNLQPGFNFSERFTRAKFEQLNADLFKGTLVLVQKVLEDGKLKKSDVDEIVLVGGSTRIPRVQQLLKDFFKGKEPIRGVNPDEAAAYGATVQAGMLTGKQELVNRVVLLDVMPRSIGIATAGGVMTKIIERNSPFPVKKRQTFSKAKDNQTAMVVQVFEGERSMTKDNRLLGKFELTGIPPAPRGQPQVEVTFDVDENSILQVSAVEKGSGSTQDVTISNDKGRFSEEEIKRMVREAQEFEEEDRKKREKVKALNSFEAAAYQLKRQVAVKATLGSKLSNEDKQTVVAAVKEALAWLDENPSAKKEEYEEAEKTLTDKTNPIVSKV